LIALEAQVRQAIRDAVNRCSRKPFRWGGLAGYEQLAAISQALGAFPAEGPEGTYLRQLARQVNRVVERGRWLAQDLQDAHAWLRRIAACLRYPPSDHAEAYPSLTSERVATDLESLMGAFQPNLWRQRGQAALYHAWHRLWPDCGADLLHCYDVWGLPPDNLAVEAIFSQLRRHQRRISGRKSTGELRTRGHYQVLFRAESEEALLAHMRQVPPAEYWAQRQRLEASAEPRRFLRRLHHDPASAMTNLLHRHRQRCNELGPDPPHTS
jgi:hypothetical protein